MVSTRLLGTQEEVIITPDVEIKKLLLNITVSAIVMENNYNTASFDYFVVGMVVDVVLDHELIA